MNNFTAAMLILILAATAAITPACKAPPSPPAKAEGAVIGLQYASFTWKDADDFKRISEYFTDKENTGADVVVRTHPETREGLYLTVGIEFGGEIPHGSIAKLEYFRPDEKSKFEKAWELPEFYGKPNAELRLGLTGEDWNANDKKKRPTAWKLIITAPDGTLLISRQSFLWSVSKKQGA